MVLLAFCVVGAGCPPKADGPITFTADPRIAMDGDGTAILVANWERKQGGESTNAVYVNVYNGTYDAASQTTTGTWPHGEPGSTNSPGLAGGDGYRLTDPARESARNPAVAMSTNGDGIAVWEQQNLDEEYVRIYASHYSGSWSAAQRINNFGKNLQGIEDPFFSTGASNPQIAMDASGNAMVVWECGLNGRICANYFDATLSSWWTLAKGIASYDSYKPLIAMDGNGNAIAIWSKSHSYGDLIYMNRFESGWTTWDQTTEEYFEMGTQYQIAGGSYDHVAVVWQEDGYVNGRVFAANAWQAPERIALGSEPRVDWSGHAVSDRALVAWQGADEGFGVYSIYVSDWVAGLGWQTTELAETNDSYAYDPRVTLNTSGRARVVWWQNDATSTERDYHVYANRVAVGTAWEGERRIDAGGDTTVDNPCVVMDDHGFAIAAWDDGESGKVSGGSVHVHVWQDWGRMGQPIARFTYSPSSPLAAEEVTFDASESSDPDGAVVDYEWDFDNDGTYDATGVTATHTFSSAGEHTVRLRVTDNRGLAHEVTETITVRHANPAPVAVFSYSPARPRWADSVSFDGSASTGSSLTYQWDFDYDGTFQHQGSASTLERRLTPAISTPDPYDPHIIYYGGTDVDRTCPPCAWEYDVVLRVLDDSSPQQTNDALQTIVVYDVLPPSARFTFVPAAPRTLQTVTFDAGTSTAGDAAIVAYEWEFYGRVGTPDAGTIMYTQSGATVSTSYAGEGDYQVLMRVTDSNGAWDSVMHTVTVSATDPTCSVDRSPTGAVIPGTPVTLTAVVPDDPLDYTFYWYADFGEGPFVVGEEQSLIRFPNSDETVTLSVNTGGEVFCTSELDIEVLESDYVGYIDLASSPYPDANQTSWFYVRTYDDGYKVLPCVWDDIYRIELALYDDTGALIVSHVVDPDGDDTVACPGEAAYQNPDVSISYGFDSVAPPGQYYSANVAVYRNGLGVGYASTFMWINAP